MKPVPKSVPAKHAPTTGHVLGKLHKESFRVYIQEPVLEEILDYSEQDLKRELGGFLVGGFHSDDVAYVEIRHFLPAVDARSKAASLTFTHETWAAMTRDVSQRFPDEQIVGWHHTHPRLRVFLSGYDLFIHRNFFKEPWQVAMVVDPVLQEFGFFQWRGGNVVDCGFVCLRGGK
jgi:proteasome lid subunit RPN8/RPN11